MYPESADIHLFTVEAHLRELHAIAAEDRRARQVQAVHPFPASHRLRRRIGLALIALGTALAGPCVPHGHGVARPG